MSDDDKKRSEDPRDRRKGKVQEGSEESFPASDPPSYNPGSPGAPPKKGGKADASANAARLRDDIDSGRTGDKVPVSDPAAAPLGTDDEAAGFPPGAEEIARARRNERRR
jgi:hypothetical protein